MTSLSFPLSGEAEEGVVRRSVDRVSRSHFITFFLNYQNDKTYQNDRFYHFDSNGVFN
jgi:hypothetical protein